MCGDKARLLFTDTDSFTYEIETSNIYDDMPASPNLYDFSDYPKTHHLYSELIKKVIGKFKGELNGDVAIEFVGLRAKMYSLLTTTEEKKRAKGVSTNVVRKRLKHQNYKDGFLKIIDTHEEQILIGQENHDLYTYKQNKVALIQM